MTSGHLLNGFACRAIMYRLLLVLFSLAYYILVVDANRWSNATISPTDNAQFCGACQATATNIHKYRGDNVVYTVPLPDTTYSVIHITAFAAIDVARQELLIHYQQNPEAMDSLSSSLNSIFISSRSAFYWPTPASRFSNSITETVSMGPLSYSTITTISETTTCVEALYGPPTARAALFLHPGDRVAQNAASTNLLETAYFSPAPTSCSIQLVGTPIYVVPIKELTVTSTVPIEFLTQDSTDEPTHRVGVELPPYFQSSTRIPLSDLDSKNSQTSTARTVSLGAGGGPASAIRQEPQPLPLPAGTALPVFVTVSRPNTASLITSSIQDLPTQTPTLTTVSMSGPSAIAQISQTMSGLLPLPIIITASSVRTSAIPSRGSMPAYAPVPPPAIIIGSSTVQINSESAYIISGQTLSAGGAVTIDSTTISLRPSAIIIGSSTIQMNSASEYIIPNKTVLASGSTISTPPAMITIGSSTIQVNSESQYIISGQTLSAGAIITVGSTTISLAPDASQIVVNSETMTISQPPLITNIGSVTMSASGGPQSTSGSSSTGSGEGQVSTGGSTCLELSHHHAFYLALTVLVSILCI